MPSLATNIAKRYSASLQSNALLHLWSKFSEWSFEYLISNLSTLSEAVGSSPLQKKLVFVSDLRTKHKALVTKYSPKFSPLTPETFSEVKKDLSKDLTPWCRVLSLGGFDEDALWRDAENSEAYRSLDSFNRDKVIDHILELPENPVSRDLVWLKNLSLDPSKDSLNRIARFLPDFEPRPGEAGSYESFDHWLKGLPSNFDAWEEVIPVVDKTNLIEHLSDTRVGIRLNNLLGASYFFPNLQEVACDLRDLLLKTKALSKS